VLLAIGYWLKGRHGGHAAQPALEKE
jgi:hypothetical protein